MRNELRPWQKKLRNEPVQDRDADLFSYPIFRGFAVVAELEVTGRFRRKLNDTGKKRWDYFFRPDLALIEEVDAPRYSHLEAKIAEIEKNRKTVVYTAASLAILGLVAGLVMSGIFAGILGGMLGAVPFGFRAEGNVETMRQERRLIDEFRERLASQSPKFPQKMR